MRNLTLTLLCLLAATAGPAFAQEDTTDADAMTEEVMEEIVEDAMADDAMADDAMADDAMADDAMADDAMADDAMADDAMTDDAMTDDAMADDPMADDAMIDDATADDVVTDTSPSLAEIAASDPNLDVTTNEEGEVDAMVMLSDVLFSFGDASLEATALDTLRGVADKLDGVTAIEITGHTDAIGDEAFNEALGQRRADAVRDWLVANTDLTAEVVSARGLGEVDPIAPNVTDAGADNPAGRAQNRRVEFTLPEEG
jgi:pentapeptide MXKDX repeat protein